MKPGYEKCVACGECYPRSYVVRAILNSKKELVETSNHHCKPSRLARRNRELRRENEQPENYCECDDLDCKFEYLDAIKCEME